MRHELHRLIDANLNRAAEGLRMLGEIARFVVEDYPLADTAREIRRALHGIAAGRIGRGEEAILERDSEGDIGRGFSANRHQSLVDLCRANARRAEESLRVLEETHRTIDVETAQRFSDLRYRTYTLEKTLVERLAPYDIARKLDFSLYVVLGRKQSRGRDFLEVTRAAIAGGAGAIQLRDKEMNKRELLDWAKRLRDLTAEAGVTFLINDHLDMALASGADGVHLGQSDFPIPEARQLAGPSMIIGASSHSLDEALRAAQEGASYVNVGPIFPTATKEGVHPPVGPKLIAEVLKQIAVPITVMGGISLSNVDLVLAQRARHVAVVSAVVGAEDITSAAAAFRARIEAAKQLDLQSQSESPEQTPEGVSPPQAGGD
ncbi:MAG: thiamine phosphate synthase [bacterium]